VVAGAGDHTGGVPIPTLATPAPDAPPVRRWKRVLVVLFCLAVALFWVYVFATGPQEDHASKLDDTSFANIAEQRCAVAQAEIGALPPARTAKSPQDRAVVLAQANQLVDELIVDLRAVVPEEARDRSLATQWLDDYARYAQARHDHQAALARGEDPEFSVPAVGGRPITLQMDAFAQLNEMPACEVPQDV
jgi:hypothetical protein